MAKQDSNSSTDQPASNNGNAGQSSGNVSGTVKIPHVPIDELKPMSEGVTPNTAVRIKGESQ